MFLKGKEDESDVEGKRIKYVVNSWLLNDTFALNILTV